MRSSSAAARPGLAIAWHLKRQGLRFVVLEAESELGHTWRDRWDSLKFFTPAQYDGLTGMPFPAPADTHPTKDRVADYLKTYILVRVAQRAAARPVRAWCHVGRPHRAR